MVCIDMKRPRPPLWIDSKMVNKIEQQKRRTSFHPSTPIRTGSKAFLPFTFLNRADKNLMSCIQQRCSCCLIIVSVCGVMTDTLSTIAAYFWFCWFFPERDRHAKYFVQIAWTEISLVNMPLIQAIESLMKVTKKVKPFFDRVVFNSFFLLSSWKWLWYHGIFHRSLTHTRHLFNMDFYLTKSLSTLFRVIAAFVQCCE